MVEERRGAGGGALPLALIYFTFFLDNVLLTVLVPIIPDWLGEGEAVSTGPGWQRAPLNASAAPLPRAAMLPLPGAGGRAALAGLVLGCKAAVQLLGAPLAGAASARGPPAALRAATALLAAAAAVLSWCGGRAAGRALCVCAGRALHGAGAALGAVSGLALASALPLAPPRRDRAVGALLGAQALGVLVGYPLGGAAAALAHHAAPFRALTAALLADLAMQILFLDAAEFKQSVCARGAGLRGVVREARRGAAAAVAGAVLLTSSVMAALEPCLPLWIMHKFKPERWTLGAVFIPDSAGYFVATSALGGAGAARLLGAERLALAGQLAVALAAFAVPLATSVGGLWAPHACLGLGVGALDAALVPALLGAPPPGRAPARAALLQAASSAAAALGPVLGGLAAWLAGFEWALRALGAANLLHAALLYRRLARHPLSAQWGALESCETESESEAEPEAEPAPAAELQPLRAH